MCATSCPLPWAVCPEHGDTLITFATQAVCRICRDTWPRRGGRCGRPVEYVVATPDGDLEVCAGHAVDPAKNIEAGNVRRSAN